MRSGTGRRLLYAATVAPPLLLSAIFALQPWVDPRWAFMDTVTAADISGEVRLYYGFISNLGVLCMTAAAAVCLFAAATLYPRRHEGGFWFLLGAGLASGWLALDDLFLLHEALLPRVGIRQEIGVAVAGFLVVGHALAHRLQIRRSEAPLMLLGLAGFATSAGLDLVVHTTAAPWVLVEDAAKFSAIVAWSGFHAAAAFRLVTPRRPEATIGDGQLLRHDRRQLRGASPA